MKLLAHSAPIVGLPCKSVCVKVKSMIRMRWTIRLGILGTVVSVGGLAVSAATPGAQSGFTVTGVHANELFCKTMITQGELMVGFTKLDPVNPDAAKRAKYFADQKALNATLVKMAPTSLASDVALQTKNSNAMIDAQQAGKAGDAARIRAATVDLSSPQHRAANKHMTDYCGVKVST
jgi:hypothetical protein